MKILCYSDLHLEQNLDWRLASGLDGDLLVLAGDILNFSSGYKRLEGLLDAWGGRHFIFVPGNHEYYNSFGNQPMSSAEAQFKSFLTLNYWNGIFLQNESIEIEGVQFYGGTMWTDFNGSNRDSMIIAKEYMNDFRLIRHWDGSMLLPKHTVAMHQRFVEGLTAWFQEDLPGPRVVITHHAPCRNLRTRYGTPISCARWR